MVGPDVAGDRDGGGVGSNVVGASVGEKVSSASVGGSVLGAALGSDVVGSDVNGARVGAGVTGAWVGEVCPRAAQDSKRRVDAVVARGKQQRTALLGGGVDRLLQCRSIIHVCACHAINQ